MRFPSKTEREQSAQVSFDDFHWDGHKGVGWWRAVVLDVEEAKTRKGADMFKITLGIENEEDVGGRCMHFVPETYPPKVTELVETFYPHLADDDEGGEISAVGMRFKRCAVLLEVDADYQRDDGAISYRVAKLCTRAKAEAAYGDDWHHHGHDEDAAARTQEEDDSEADLF